MDYDALILGLFLILACTLIVLFISSKLRLPTIIGFFLAGILVGPSGLHLFTYEQVELVAEFGIILLMFTIGLDISIKNLLSMKKIVLIGGGVQVLLTTLAVWLLLQAVGLPSGASLLVGMMAATSSTAIVLNIYQNNGQIDARHGKIALGILIFQDLAVIPMMLITPMLAEAGSFDITSSLIQLAIGMTALVIVLVAALYIVPRILDKIAAQRSRELFIISVLTICFGIAWILSLNGVSLSLGAFLAGVAISGSEYSHEVIGLIMPIRDILTSFFFISVGMLLSISYMIQNILLIVALLILLILGKTFITTISAKAAGAATGTALLSGIGLAQIGEFSFVLGTTGISLGILTNDLYQTFLAIAILSMTITPFAIGAAPKITAKLARPKIPADRPDFADSQTCSIKPSNHVIVVGYGVAGKYVIRALKKVGKPYLIIEMNPETVKHVKQTGEHIIYGDAGHETLLEYAGITRASTLVITIPDTTAIKNILSNARRLNPKIPIITRSKYISDTTTLFRLGADEVIADEREAAIQISRRIFANENIADTDLVQYIKQIRAEVYAEITQARSSPDAKPGKIEHLVGTLEPKSKTTFTLLQVGKNSSVDGQPLCKLHLRTTYSTTVVSLRHSNGEPVLPIDGNTILSEGDIVELMGTETQLTLIKNLFKES